MSWTKRRAFPRARIRLEAAYEDAHRQVFLHTRDLSEEGVYFFSPDPPEVGAAARLVLELPGHPQILRIRGQVARRDTGPRSGFAVRFEHDDGDRTASDPRSAIRKFVSDTARSTGELQSS
jgi:hypothetical protein